MSSFEEFKAEFDRHADQEYPALQAVIDAAKLVRTIEAVGEACAELILSEQIVPEAHIEKVQRNIDAWAPIPSE